MVEKFILGTVQFGLHYGINNNVGKPTEEEVFEILDDAFIKGIETLDTADAYGNAIDIIGNYNRKSDNKFLFNTKFKGEHTSLNIQIENTLKRLRTNFINVYFYHSYNDFITNQDLKLQLLELKMKGKIRKIGLSVYENDEFKNACDSELIDVIQFPYNLLDNFNQRGELMSLAKKSKKELHVRSVFLQGLFFKDINQLGPVLSPLRPYLEEIRNIAKKENISVQELAQSFVLQEERLDKVIIGVDSKQQLNSNIGAAKILLSQKVIDQINQIHVKEIDLLYPKNW